MPGRFFVTRSFSEIAPILNLSKDQVPAEPPRRNIQPGEEIVVYDGALRRMRWGIIPVGRKNARGRPVMETIINARSETLFDKSAFEGVGRAVIPVNGWYEWTGQSRRKQAWAITPNAHNWLFFAAITDTWFAPGGLEVPQVAAVTCEPNTDVRDIHHRMAVILAPDDISVWLSSDEIRARSLLKPWPDGQLSVSKVTDVDWSSS